MRVRDHVALSTAGAALLGPLVGRRAWTAWAASILIDLDHYVWYALHERRLDPAEAVRFFDRPSAPNHPATRILHHPAVLAAVGLLSARQRGLRPLLLGMGFHVALDAHHRQRLSEARAAAVRRDGGICQRCGSLDGEVTAHLWHQPAIVPSYQATNFVTLCDRCHQDVHQRSSWRPPGTTRATGGALGGAREAGGGRGR